jgi:hypothetical protein
LVVEPLDVGAVYETETLSPATMFVPTVRVTVEPVTETAVGLKVIPFSVMV